jgi:DNA-binding transcriptional MerR regulator
MTRANKVLDFFSSGEVATLSGLSKYMVDYLCRHGLLTASHSRDRGYGKRRRFNFTDILLAKTIKEMLSANVSVLSLRKALMELRRQLHFESPSVLRDKRILIRGGVPYLLEPAAPPRDLLAGGQMVFSFVLEIRHLWQTAEPIRARRQQTERARIERALRRQRERVA